MFFLKRKHAIRRKVKPGYFMTIVLVLVLILLPAAYTIITRFNAEAAANAFSFWHFDEGIDNTCTGGSNDACDSMTAGANDLARTNATWQNEDACYLGKCLYFDGSGDYLSTVTDNNDFDFAAADTFSISGWFRHPTIATNPDYLIAKHNATAGGYKIYMNNDGTLTFGVDDDSTFTPDDAATSTQRFDDNQWHHFTAVKNGTTDITLYVDGQQVGQDASIAATGTLVNSDIMYIGVDGNGSSNSWEGFLDEIKFYNYVRSSTLVKTEMTTGSSARGVSASLGGRNNDFLTNSLKGYWKLDETSGNVADASGNSLTLTNNGTTTFVTGQFGNGSEHVPASLQHFSTATTISSVQSVSFWTNPDSTTNYYLSLNGSAYVTSSAGTLSATGFTNAKIYVNGVESTTVTQDVWQLVTVTTDTAISASQFYIGRQGSNYYDGTLDEVRVYGRQLSPNEIRQMYSWAPGPSAIYNFDENATLTPGTSAPMPGMVVFSDLVPANDDLIYYRIMNANGTWAAAASAASDVDSGSSNRVPQIVKLFSNTVRNEKIMLSSHFDGTTNFYLYGQVWDGSSWGAATLFDSRTTTQFNPQDPYFDGTYLANGDFMVVYADNTATPKFQIWNGNAWTGSGTSTQSVGSQPYHVIARARPGTNEVMVVTQDLLEDTNSLYYDGIGTAASDWTLLTPEHSTDSPDNSRIYFDFAWSKNSPTRGLLAYEDGPGDNTTNVNIFTANGTGGGSWGTANEAVDTADPPQSPVVVDRPGTNEFIFCSKDTTATTPDINCMEENDNDTSPTVQATTNGEVSTGTDAGDTAQVPFSIGYEQSSAATAIIVYSDATSTPKLKKYDPTSGSVGTWDAAATSLTAMSGAVEQTIVRPQPYRDDMAILMRDTNEDLAIVFWDGANNAVYASGDRDQETLSTSSGFSHATYEPIPADFAWDNHSVNANTTLYDRSGNSNTATFGANLYGVQNGFVAGRYGTAGNFDGVNDYATITDSATLDFTGSFSISAWVKHTTQSSGQDIILAKHNATAGGYKVLMESDGDITCAIDDDSTWTPDDSATSTAATYDDNAWHHVECVKDASSLKLYIDGVLIATDSTLAATGTLANADTLYIGIDGDGASNAWLGLIDDVRLYQYARDAGQVEEDMNGGHPLGGSPIASQVAYWKLDEGYGTTVNNTGSNTYTTSVDNGATWYQQQKTGITGCKINHCLSFDGSNDVLTITNTNSIDFDTGLSTGFTFSAWINAASTGEGSAGQIFFKGTNTYLAMNAGGSLSASVDLATTDATLTATYPITIGSWYHVALSYSDDSDDELTIWVNGVPIGSSTNGVGSLATGDTNNLLIGGTTTNNFSGRIDDVKVYSAELSKEEIGVDYNANAAINLSTSTTEEVDLTDGIGPNPVGWWKFDENTGTTTANDVSGNGLALTLTNFASTDWANGYSGSAYTGDGTNNIALISGSSSTLEPTQPTVMAWVYARNTSTCVDGGACPQIIADVPQGSAGDGRGYTLDLITGVPRFCIGNASGSYSCATGATTVSLNTWVHVAGSYDGSTVRVYLNGVLDGSTSASVTISYTNAGAGGPTTKAFYVGNMHNNNATSNTTTTDMRHFNGFIDDAKVFNYALTQPQIAIQALRGKPVGWWKMDECTGTTLNDSSYHSKTIGNKTGTWSGATGGNTSAGTCSSGTGTEAWNNGTTGKRNYSLDFDGTDDVVTVSNSRPITISSGLSRGFTISAWINPDSAGEGSAGQIFSKGNTYLRVDTLSGGLLDLEANLDFVTTDANVNASAAVPTGSWSHVAMTYSPSANTISVFVNGQLRGTSSAGTGGLSTDSSSLLIGGGTSNNFDGKIDDFKVYSFILAATQLRKSMNDESAVTFEPSTGAP